MGGKLDLAECKEWSPYLAETKVKNNNAYLSTFALKEIDKHCDTGSILYKHYL